MKKVFIVLGIGEMSACFEQTMVEVGGRRSGRLPDLGPCLYRNVFRIFDVAAVLLMLPAVLALIARDSHSLFYLALREWHTFQKLSRHPRITAFGCFLRKTSFDELPQLWNVLKGAREQAVAATLCIPALRVRPEINHFDRGLLASGALVVHRHAVAMVDLDRLERGRLDQRPTRRCAALRPRMTWWSASHPAMMCPRRLPETRGPCR